MHAVTLYIFYLIVSLVKGLYEGDECTLNPQKNGTCVIIKNCRYAKDLLRQNKLPKLCGFNNGDPIVCCLGSEEVIDTVGHKAEEMCKVYAGIGSRPIRSNRLPGVGIAGGTESLSQEFPHMAALGYGDEREITFLCGGSLISEDFILTAAHCLHSPEYGNVRWVRLGDLDLESTDDIAEPQHFAVGKTYAHPEYNPPGQYHDIALLKLESPAKFTPFVRPACLYTKQDIPERTLIATGWGSTSYGGDKSNHLMKVVLNFVDNDRCKREYEPLVGRKLPDGILEESQICAGDQQGKDTCQGDSGGPLQVRGLEGTMLHIVGVTSFGRPCALTNTPGIYTRVSSYLNWIEPLVWK